MVAETFVTYESAQTPDHACASHIPNFYPGMTLIVTYTFVGAPLVTSQ